MARFSRVIRSTLSPAQAFAYMADFTNVPEWDHTASDASRLDDGPIGLGSEFRLTARFAGRSVPLTYRISEFDDGRRFVIEARRPSAISRDTVTVTPREDGSDVAYDAVLEMTGWMRLAAPVVSLLFARLGASAVKGLERVLQP